MIKKMQEQSNIELSESPSIHYEKFFAKFAEIETLPVDKWNATLLIGYFCKLYKSAYNIDYTFRFDNKSPSKSYEVFQINKLAKMLSKKPTILKDYIDWFYKEKITLKKKRITSMAYLTDVNIVNEYKFKFLIVKPDANIDRTTKLPPNVLETTTKFDKSIQTYGELAFMKRYVDGDSAEQKYVDMFSEIVKSGFDIKLLDRVK
jgi:hypothetical protein